jgi:putative endonuclease
LFFCYNWLMGLLFWKKEKLSIGSFGEKVAARYLREKGYKILDLNFKNPSGKRLGEIDIVAKKDGEIVFVEVKTRQIIEGRKILPEENIDTKKLHRLNKIARFYINSNNFRSVPYHFDAISVWASEDQKNAKVKHLENIFI